VVRESEGKGKRKSWGREESGHQKERTIVSRGGVFRETAGRMKEKKGGGQTGEGKDRNA